MQVVIATRNAKKLNELKEILGEEFELLTLDSFPNAPEVIEDGTSFTENALKKATEIFEFTGITAIADDSGLEVDALDKKPGIHSARFSGENATDEQNNELLLQKLANVPEQERTAKFVCVIAVVGKNIRETFEGSIEGTILLAPFGKNGFGYDPLFFVKGHCVTFAQMPNQLKNKISHRSQALQKLFLNIERLLKLI
ncbi:XTP/dITP diphosphatase [bacterium]|nr:XTP/dITP diphosphatase [bacterium]